MSRINHNANYLYDVEGETVWEKLRVIRGMLQDREIGYNLAVLELEHKESKYDTDSYEYKKWMIHKPQQEQLIKECFEEIKFLKEYEQFLASEAEKTRIPGKSDDEMYEINFFDELKYKLVRKAMAQMVSYDRIQDDLMYRLLKHEDALKLCVEEGILSNEILRVAYSAALPSTPLITTEFKNKQLLSHDK